MAVATKYRRLTHEQVKTFLLYGHITVRDVFTPEEIRQLGERVDTIAAGKASHIPETSIQLEKVFRDGQMEVTDQVLSVRKLYDLAMYDDLLWAHATNPKVVDIVADLLNTDDIKLYQDQLFMKPPIIGAETPWHQDSGAFRDIFPMDLVTAWCAIDDASVDNGCLNFVPGTHRWGMMRRKQLEPFLPTLGSDQWPIVPAPVPSGSVSFHHSLLLHQSNANTSGRRRRGYALHYMRANSRKDESVADAPKVPPFKQIRGRSFEGCV